MTPHIATIRIKMPQNGTRERLLSSRNLSTKDLSASTPVVNEVVLGSSLNKGKKKRKGRALAVSARSPQDPAPEHEANFLLPNFWLSEPRPLPVRLPHPYRL